ncbi:MAG: hypothetical protein U5L45_15815 [Saprospiraceae bacterium]|nr:hypothetical protein [Saprospiraceae bacterium]
MPEIIKTTVLTDWQRKTPKKARQKNSDEQKQVLAVLGNIDWWVFMVQPMQADSGCTSEFKRFALRYPCVRKKVHFMPLLKIDNDTI